MDFELHRKSLKEFVSDGSFPCIMAKAILKTGFLCTNSLKEVESTESIKEIQQVFYSFIDTFRENPHKLSSFILIFDNPRYLSYEKFEKVFWRFLILLSKFDKRIHPHDPRVSSDPNDDKFSYSVKSEAFFILMLHPNSPRWARRFKYPAIIFNPHVQFENLRAKNLFNRIRAIIRRRDELLQGEINPMLNDYGERSEVFQYSGKKYAPGEAVPLLI